MELMRGLAFIALLFAGSAVGAELRQAEVCGDGTTHQLGFCPAVLSSASCSATGATTGSCSATSDETDGTRYVCATSSATALTGAEIEACSGGAAIAGAIAAETGSNSVSLSGLTTDAAHYGQIVNESPEGWYSNRLVSSSFTPSAESSGNHDFTGLPYSGGWHDLDAIIAGSAYDDSRIIFLSDGGNDSTAGPGGDASPGYYTKAQLDNPSTAVTNPGSVNAYRTYAAAEAQMRDGFADVLLIERGSDFSGTTITFTGWDGASASGRFIVASYGSLALSRPTLANITQSRFTTGNYGIFAGFEVVGTTINVWGRANYMLFEDIYFNTPSGSPEFQMNLQSGDGNAVRRVATRNRPWFVFIRDGNSAGTGIRWEENTIDYSNGQHNIYADAANQHWYKNQSLRAAGAAFRNRGQAFGATDIGSVHWANLAVGDPANSPNDSSFDIHQNNDVVQNVMMHAERNFDITSMRGNSYDDNIMSFPDGLPAAAMFRFRDNYEGNWPGHEGANTISGNVSYSGPGLYQAAISFGSDQAAQLQAGATLTISDNDMRTAVGSFDLASIANDADVIVTADGSSTYYHPGSTGSWFGGRTYASLIPSTGSAVGSAGAGFSDPDRTILTYMNQYGSYASISDASQAYAANARANRRGSWDERWTAEAVINYVRAGFDKAPIGDSPP